MCDKLSPLYEFYPLEFEVDGEGKRQDYEAVVLVPFIDKEALLQAYDSVDQVRSSPGSPCGCLPGSPSLQDSYVRVDRYACRQS